MRTLVAAAAVLLVVCTTNRLAGEEAAQTEAVATLPARIAVDIEVKTLTGAPRTDVLNIVVSLYAHKESTEPLWSEEQTVKPNDAGKLAVLAGATTDAGIPAQLFTSTEARWIGIAVKGEEEQPRIMVLSVPYAVRARDADTIAGRPATDFVRTEEFEERVRKVLTNGGARSPQAMPATMPRKTIMPVLAAPPRSHVVPASAAGTFQNFVSGPTVGVYGSSSSTSAGTILSGATGVYGEISSTDPGPYSAAVRGINDGDGPSGIGVLGYHAGSGWGVLGQTESGLGVHGRSGLGGVGVFASSTVVATPSLAGTALEVNNGAIKVSGSVRAAFTLVGAVTTLGTSQTLIAIDNVLSNNDPNAILFVTPLGSGGLSTLYVPDDPKPFFVAYVPDISKWGIFHNDLSAMTAGTKFHVLIVKQ